MTNHDYIARRKAMEQEISANAQKFQAMTFDESQDGKYALMRHGKLVDIFPTYLEARRHGREMSHDKVYSVHGINEQPVEFVSFEHV